MYPYQNAHSPQSAIEWAEDAYQSCPERVPRWALACYSSAMDVDRDELLWTVPVFSQVSGGDEGPTDPSWTVAGHRQLIEMGLGFMRGRNTGNDHHEAVGRKQSRITLKSLRL